MSDEKKICPNCESEMEKISDNEWKCPNCDEIVVETKKSFKSPSGTMWG